MQQHSASSTFQICSMAILIRRKLQTSPLFRLPALARQRALVSNVPALRLLNSLISADHIRHLSDVLDLDVQCASAFLCYARLDGYELIVQAIAAPRLSTAVRQYISDPTCCTRPVRRLWQVASYHTTFAGRDLSGSA